MGFFDRFRKDERVEEQEIQAFDVPLDELTTWYEDNQGSEIKSKRSQAEGLFNDIIDSFELVKEKLMVLDKAKITSGERLHIASNMIKDNFVKKKYVPINDIKNFSRDFRPDFSYFEIFQKKSLLAVKQLQESTPKQTILLQRFFKKESSEVVEGIKRTEEKTKELGDFLENSSGSFGTMERIKVAKSEIESFRADASGQEERLQKLTKEIEAIRTGKKETEKEYLDLLKSKEWNSFSSIRKEETRINDDLAKNEVDLKTELSSIKKDVKLAEHVISKKGKLTPIQKNSLRDFIRDPFKMYTGRGGDKNLLSSLKSAKKQLAKIGEGDCNINDVIGKVEGEISSLSMKRQELLKELASTKKRIEELSKLEERKNEMEQEIKKKTDKIGELDNELRESKSRKSDLEFKEKESLKDLETAILHNDQKRVSISP